MISRRKFFLSVTTAVVALAVAVAPAIAAELFGTIKEVDAEAKKVVVTPKGKNQEDVEVTIKDDTEIVTPKGKKVALEKLKKGARVEITHENAVASKVVVKGVPKKKGASSN